MVGNNTSVGMNRTLNAVQQSELSPANTPGVIVLQWLTYAFWGWTILSLIWLTYIVIANIILGSDMTPVIPYAIASVLVLFPLSFTLDLFYGRKEQARKTGAATVVMVIHAVLFAVCGIGVLIGAVFTTIELFISDATNTDIQVTILLTLLFSAVFYGLTFIRTLNPSPKVPIAKSFKFIMAFFIGLFLVLAFIGPVAKSITTKDDRAIESNLPLIGFAIERYVSENDNLPASLADISLSEPEAKKLIEQGLVQYKPEPGAIEKQLPRVGGDNKLTNYEYRYQLCATYKVASKKSGSGYYNPPKDDNSEYQEYLAATPHAAGEVCYKLKTNVTRKTQLTTSSSRGASSQYQDEDPGAWVR